MRKYKLWFASVLTIFIFLSSPVLATNKGQLSLAQAVDLALQRDFDLKIASLNLNNKQVDYQQGKADNILAQSRTEKLQNKLALKQAKNDYQQRKKQIIIEVVDQYLKLGQKKLNIKTLQSKLELRKKELKNIRIQVEKGNKRQIELMEKQTEYNSAQYNLKKVQDEYNLLLQQFKFNLGLTKGQKTDFKLLTSPEFWQLTNKKAKKIAKKNNLILAVKKEKIELAEVKLKRSQAEEASQLSIEKLKNNKQLAKLQYQKSLKQLLTSVSKYHQKLKQAEASLKLRKQQLTQVQEKYKIIKEYQQQGLRSKNELLKAKIDYLQAKYNYQKSITSYYLAALELQQKIGLQVGVNFNELVPKK